MKNEIAFLDACEVAAKIAAKEISAVEVMEIAIRRAETLQSSLNAFISLEAESALKEARAIDDKIARGEGVGLLAGVPLAHKDMYYRKGKVTTCGSKIRANYVADRTSTVLARLEAAGALYLGGLNMSEFAVGPIGNNVHYGDCRNPWNTDHAPGGSSSGSGATVAARIVYGALGSDTGGSIRIPSSMSGVVGFKPTQTRVSRYGLMPLSFSFDCGGPLTRTVRDAARILDVISGYDSKDSTSSRRPAGGYEEACLRDHEKLIIGIPNSYYYDDLEPEVRALVEGAQRVLLNLGLELIEADVPTHDEMNLIWASALAAEAATIHRKWLVERPNDYGAMVRRRIEFGLYQPATRYLEALTMRDTFLREYCNVAFRNCDILLTPTMPIIAPKLSDVDVGDSADMPDLVLRISKNTRPISYLGLPALSVPCGFTSGGLPTAFQLIGRPFDEAPLCTVGHAYQQATEWHYKFPLIAS